MDKLFCYCSKTGEPIFTKLDHAYSLRPEEILERWKVRKLFSVRVAVRAVVVAPKVRTIEEWRQEHFCFFRRGYFRYKGNNPKMSVLCSSSNEDIFCSSETKHDVGRVPRPEMPMIGFEARKIDKKILHNNTADTLLFSSCKILLRSLCPYTRLTVQVHRSYVLIPIRQNFQMENPFRST
jgi:hypothetical protein